MGNMVFDAPAWPSLPVAQGGSYPVRRIFCVGRNYAAHAAEMGAEVDREAPFYFTKSPLALWPSGGSLPYPPGTSELHHEVELVAALGAAAFRATPEAAAGLVYGYAVGLDMTRRDLQARAKDKRRPWSTAKDFEGSAVIAPLSREFTPATQQITLSVDGKMRQQGLLSDMVWSLSELIADLSHYYHLGPGDLIMTGTPAGVGPVSPGAKLHGEIDGLPPLDLRITEPEG
ncbi:MAG: fumarylacetoacetate hydrolase family protein [Paracoccus sp. (in: a-proteobacteria)]|nr:fumarylacetoacetate hydrolase family protein [Paracoccus sp. (in: a-proteobacteria)]